MTIWFVSRHPGALAWMQHQGETYDQHIRHLDLDRIRPGDEVIGTLPVHLAAEVCARGARYRHLSLQLPDHARGQELSAAEMNACAARLETYFVRKEA